MATSDQPTGSESSAAGSVQPQIQPTIEPETLEPIYTNFARVTGTPEELILDFGLNTQAVISGGTPGPVKISNRLVMNYYTAKRVWHTLAVSLQRHEETFGVIEVDVTKRIIPQARAQRQG